MEADFGEFRMQSGGTSRSKTCATWGFKANMSTGLWWVQISTENTASWLDRATRLAGPVGLWKEFGLGPRCLGAAKAPHPEFLNPQLQI